MTLHLILLLSIFTTNNRSMIHKVQMSKVVNIDKECPNNRVIVAYIDDMEVSCNDRDIWSTNRLIYR